MHLSITVALAAFPFLVGAVPVHNSRDNLLSIPLSKRWLSQLSDNDVPSPPHNSRDKFRRGFEAFERNTGKRHPLAPKYGRSDNSSAPGTIPLANHTFMWSGTIQVGTPSKEYSVDFDTATADLILFGSSCPSCQGHNTYDPSQSSSANDLKTPFNLTYSLGNIAGDMVTDSVTVGGFEVSNETLGVASEIGPNLNATNFAADGILGMGFKGLSLFNSSSVFETLFNGSQIPEPVVGMVLADSNPELIVGGRDSSRYSGDLVYTPVDTGNAAYWHTKLDGISINGNDTEVSTLEAIIDSGSSLVLGNSGSIANIYASIPGSSRVNESDPLENQFWTYPCNATVNLSIAISNTSFSISSEAFKFAEESDGFCVGSFVEFPAGSEDPGFWVLGDAFLRNVYTEFDYGKLQIGFAQIAS
ncbi:acid protease [Russula vinacea]|nr:acid protease [Russula vinacea]